MGDGVSADGLRLLRLIGDTPGSIRELSVAEQRYEAVRTVHRVSDELGRSRGRGGEGRRRSWGQVKEMPMR
jgi:hypothetical protein